MSRTLSLCVCAMLAFVMMASVPLVTPPPALAATGVLSMETPLHDAPDPGAAVIALLPEGTVVSIDGAPIDGFYPVSTGELSGWMRGETMSLEKDVPYEGEDTAPAVDAIQEWLPAAQTADAGAPVDPALTGDVAAVEAPVGDAAEAAPEPAEAAPADALVTEPVPDSSGADVLVATVTTDAVVDAPVSDAIYAEPAPVETPVAGATGEIAAPAADPALDGANTAPVAGTETPAAADLAAAPATTEPAETPAPVVAEPPSGPASAIADVPVYYDPDPGSGLVFTVPAGSTLVQTGQVNGGFVSVQYKEVVGWARQDLLGAPIEPSPEAAVNETVDTRTPRPGSGVAFTVADVSLRAGPSASEAPLTAVPAGTRIELTGVMENGFQRVRYEDQLGWIADDLLETPADPTPAAGGGKKGKTQDYSRREIVKIIYAAADRYDQPREDMLRVAQCESNLDPYAVNPSGSYGLFQFIRSTWKSTPYGDEDVFDPRANANAAGWMWAQGRKSEWVCQ